MVFVLYTLIWAVLLLAGYFKSLKIKLPMWMDRNYTTILKGFSIITVVWAHSCARIGVGNIQFIAGIGVALFLICSGYGMERSYQKNGLKNYWKNRFLGVLIPFWLIEVIGLPITGQWSWKRYLLDALMIERLTSYGWFIRYIFICYLIFFVIKQVNKIVAINAQSESALYITAFAVWFILSSTILLEPGRPFTEPRQMLSFPVGILIAKYQDEIERKTEEKTSSILLMLFGGGYRNCVYGCNAAACC